VCVAVEGRFLQADDVAGLRASAVRAEAGGAGAVFLAEGPLGDPVVLAAGLSASVRRVLLGVRVDLTAAGSRHPAVLAREMTSLDHVCGGRSLLCVGPPFTGATVEAVVLCRSMWRDGTATSDGPVYPVRAAVNRPRPPGVDSPLVAVDLTAGTTSATVPPSLSGLVDLVLLPTEDPSVCRVERP